MFDPEVMLNPEVNKVLCVAAMVAVVVWAVVYWRDGGDDPPSGLT